MKKKLSKKELNEYKNLLNKRKMEILDSIDRASEETIKKSQKDASGDISGYSFHMADVATDTYDREFSLSMVSNDRRALYELSHALKRIEDGTYGICEDCKEHIAKTRLEALPSARVCLSCQEQREKKGR